METTLKDIGVYKHRLITAITSSGDILDAVLETGYSKEQADGIVYTQVFPYLYVDDTDRQPLSYICVEVDVPKIPNTTVKNCNLIIWVYCPNEKMDYSKDDYSGTRTDIISDMIDRQLKASHDFGIGRPNLSSAAYFVPKSGFYGRKLIYELCDFKVKGN